MKRVAIVLLWLLPFAVTAVRAAEAPVFSDWPDGVSPTAVGRRVAELFVASPHVIWNEYGTIQYSEVCAWYGALRYAHLAHDKALAERLVDRFQPLFGSEAKLVPPINHVDNSVFGALPLELYRETSRAPYRVLGLAFADGQWDNPDAAGLTRQTRFWIDDMYMITLLQVQAFRATGDARYLDRAATEMAAYLDRLQQPNGLFFHALDAPFHWGRGNGWVAAGMTELLSVLPDSHPRYARILDGYRKMMAALLAHQSDEGMWRQLVDRPETWPESSCTGMFTYAFVTGVKRGWLDAASYGPAARKAWLALVGRIDPNGAVRDVCVGTGAGSDLQYYLDRPRVTGDLHGQAPILWSAAALLEE